MVTLSESALINKITKLHKKIEQDTGNKYEISIFSQTTNKNIVIGDLDKREKYVVYDMKKWKSLEGEYESIEEFEEKAKKFCKQYNIDKRLLMNPTNGNIYIKGNGKPSLNGKLTSIGKVKISN
jgi:hypothetical protein